MTDSTRRSSGKTPINKQTALSLGKGVQDPRPSKLGHSPTVLTGKAMEQVKSDPRFVDLTDRQFGRLTVKGLQVERSSNGRAWVCLCICGRFEAFQRQTLLNGTRDRCSSCDLAQKSREGGLPLAVSKRKPQKTDETLPSWYHSLERACPEFQVPRSLPKNRNCTGKLYGSLRVIGQSIRERDGRTKSLLWVCLCKCGFFVLRPRRVLLTNKPPLCPACENTESSSKESEK